MNASNSSRDPNKTQERNKFGKRIDEYLGRGVSQEALAKASGYSSPTFSRFCTGGKPLNREDVIRIVKGLLNLQEKLAKPISAEGASELLSLANLEKLNPEIEEEKELIRKLTERAKKSPDSEESPGPPPKKKKTWHWIYLAIVFTAVMLFVICKETQQVIFTENFSPLKESNWDQVSAWWVSSSRGRTDLKENNPNEAFGRVESKPITVNLKNSPVLKIGVTEVDLHSSFVVQLIDKKSNSENHVVVIESTDHPGEFEVDLASDVNWKNDSENQSFTINIWMEGEGKAATFSHVHVILKKKSFKCCSN